VPTLLANHLQSSVSSSVLLTCDVRQIRSPSRLVAQRPGTHAIALVAGCASLETAHFEHQLPHSPLEATLFKLLTSSVLPDFEPIGVEKDSRTTRRSVHDGDGDGDSDVLSTDSHPLYLNTSPMARLILMVKHRWDANLPVAARGLRRHPTR
jgi:hypothetical protein